MQRLFNTIKFKTQSFTPNKVLNILIYGSPFYLIIYTIYKFKKMVLFMAHPVEVMDSYDTLIRKKVSADSV